MVVILEVANTRTPLIPLPADQVLSRDCSSRVLLADLAADRRLSDQARIDGLEQHRPVAHLMPYHLAFCDRSHSTV